MKDKAKVCPSKPQPLQVSNYDLLSDSQLGFQLINRLISHDPITFSPSLRQSLQVGLGWPRTLYVAQVGLELPTSLPLK